MGVTNFDIIQANGYLGLPASSGSGESSEETTGTTFYVGNSTTLPQGGVSGSDGNNGLSPLTPFATLDFAVGRTTAGRGDRIIVMPGHAESSAAAATLVTVDMAGINIIGQGQGASKPTFTNISATDLFTVTAANVEISGLRFAASTTAASTARLNIAAANARVHGCTFLCGAQDAETITITADGDDAEVYQNEFRVTANAPTSAIRIEAAGTNGVRIYGNLFNGGSQTNTWDNAAIESTVAHTNCLIDGNHFIYGPALVVATSVSTTVGPNNVYSLAPSNAAAPQVWYCDLGTTIRDGKAPETPTTLNDAAVTKATAGDTVFILAGSTSSPTTSQALSVAGVKVVGLGNRRNRPVITPNGTVDILDLTGANVVVDNLAFAAATAVSTSYINLGAADCTVSNCEFLAGASTTNAVITVPDAGDRGIITGNEFLVTANGPAIAISVEAAGVDGLRIEKNLFNGGNGTNQWDTAAINSGVAHTNCVIQDNTFLYGTAMVVATSVSTTVRGNKYGVGSVPNAATPLTIYVDNGSTIRDGFSPETPTTLANAVDTLVRANVGDKILCLPGTYTLAATVTLDSGGITIAPYVDNGTYTVTFTTSSDIDLITWTGANCHLKGIRLLANAAQVTTPFLIDFATGDFNRVSDCFFDCANVASLSAINIAAGSTDNLIDHNRFTGQVTAVSQIVDLGARTNVVDNAFSLLNTAPSAWTNVGGAADLHQVFARNTLQGDGGARTGMIVPLSASAEEFSVSNNRFSGTSSATPFGQNANWPTQFSENYVASGAGGVLIDPVA